MSTENEITVEALLDASGPGLGARARPQDDLRVSLGLLADMAGYCRRCGDWFYTPTGHIPQSGCDLCKPIRELLPAWSEVASKKAWGRFR